MSNVYDALDDPAASQPNPYDALDAPKAQAAANPYDALDEKPTLGEQFIETGKNVLYGGSVAASQGLKGMGLLEAAPVQQEVRDLQAEQLLQQSMSPEDSIPPEAFVPGAAKDIRDSKTYQWGKALDEKAEAAVGLREGIIPDIVRDVSRGVGQVGTNIAMGAIPFVGIPTALATGVLGGIGEAGRGRRSAARRRNSSSRC